MTLKKGYVQIYTGNGKGKTTAAVGLGVRAAGHGLKVYMLQFLKTMNTGELESLKKLEANFRIFRFETVKGFFYKLSEEEKVVLKKQIKEEYDFCIKALKKKSCDILILDEIMGALSNNLITEKELINLINIKPENIELILTGRNAPKSIIELADLVTEMKELKHYYNEGVSEREGIEF